MAAKFCTSIRRWLVWPSPYRCTEFRRLRWPQFVVAGGHNIPKSQGSLFAAGGWHSYLWPEATRFNDPKVPATAGASGHTRDGQWCSREPNWHRCSQRLTRSTSDGSGTPILVRCITKFNKQYNINIQTLITDQVPWFLFRCITHETSTLMGNFSK